MLKKSSAFSLIELSIVILIIGIIIAGVTQGSRLVRQFKIQSAQTITKSSPVSSIRGLVLWLEPTLAESFQGDGYEDLDPVYQWNDINPQSTQKYSLTGLENLVPLYKESSGPNGLPSMIFDGVNDGLGMTTPIITQNNEFTFFAVYAASDIIGAVISNGLMEGVNNVFTGWHYFEDGGRSINRFETGPDWSTTSAEICAAIFKNGAISTWINGLLDFNNEIIEVSTPTVGFHVGNSAAGNTAFQGYISEVIVFDRPLKIEERQSIEDYLGRKYNIKITR